METDEHQFRQIVAERGLKWARTVLAGYDVSHHVEEQESIGSSSRYQFVWQGMQKAIQELNEGGGVSLPQILEWLARQSNMGGRAVPYNPMTIRVYLQSYNNKHWKRVSPGRYSL